MADRHANSRWRVEAGKVNYPHGVSTGCYSAPAGTENAAAGRARAVGGDNGDASTATARNRRDTGTDQRAAARLGTSETNAAARSKVCRVEFGAINREINVGDQSGIALDEARLIGQADVGGARAASAEEVRTCRASASVSARTRTTAVMDTSKTNSPIRLPPRL